MLEKLEKFLVLEKVLGMIFLVTILPKKSLKIILSVHQPARAARAEYEYSTALERFEHGVIQVAGD